MKYDEIADEAIESIQKVAAMAAQHLDDKNPGATMLALMITAYSRSIGEYLEAGFLTLDEALECTLKDLLIVQNCLREQAVKIDAPDKSDLTT